MKETYNIFHNQHVVQLFTHAKDGGLHGRDMTVYLRPQDPNAVWFATARNSLKVKEIEKNQNVIINYKDPFKREKIIVLGTAEIVDDMTIKQDLWRDPWLMFFPNGVESKSLILLKVTINRSD